MSFQTLYPVLKFIDVSLPGAEGSRRVVWIHMHAPAEALAILFLSCWYGTGRLYHVTWPNVKAINIEW